MKPIIKTLFGALLPDAYKPFTMFPYRFVGEPRPIETGVSDSGLPFARHGDVCVHFPRGTSRQEMETVYRGYLEDEGLTGLGRRTKSPHCYVTSEHRPEPGEIIVDIGCSEGFFARSFATGAKRIYLFEGDKKWGEPLAETFRDCEGKVVLTQKYVGDKSDGDVVRLEDVVRGSQEDVFFLKLDVEGAERGILESSRKFLRSNRVKMSCCAYHRQSDGKYLTGLLREMGFATQYSEGWMLPYGGRTFPFFRHGVIYARNY